VLGVRAARGRLLSPRDDETPGAHRVAVISHALWQNEFGGAADILSQTLTLRSGRHPIVGVVPPAFLGVEIGRRFEVALPVLRHRILLNFQAEADGIDGDQVSRTQPHAVNVGRPSNRTPTWRGGDPCARASSLSRSPLWPTEC